MVRSYTNRIYFAMPPRSRRRQRRRRRRKLQKPQVPDVLNRSRDSPPVDAISQRDWAELPLDAILYIFRELDQAELLRGGVSAVCRSWRRAARDEPELWRRIDTRGRLPGEHKVHERVALRLSAGQCEAFWSDHHDDSFLLFLAHRAPLLRSLRLKFCLELTNEGFAAAITKFPLLEELELENCPGIDHSVVLEHVARACPRMKHIAHIKCYSDFNITDPDNDREALAISSMTELRTLQLFHDKLTNAGLTSIIDNCAHLESLDIRNCGNITMDDALRAKCSKIRHSVFEDYHDDIETDSAISSLNDLLHFTVMGGRIWSRRQTLQRKTLELMTRTPTSPGARTRRFNLDWNLDKSLGRYNLY